MRASYALFLLVVGSATAADWPFPCDDGTTWRYTLLRQPDSERATLTRRVNAIEPSQGDEELQMETAINGATTSTHLLRNTPQGIMAQSSESEENRSEVLVLPDSLEQGASWQFLGEMAGLHLDLPVRALEEEDVQVPAGQFRGWHIHGEQHGSLFTTADEWFVRGIGSVKEVVTQRGPAGDLLAQNVLELLTLPAKEAATTRRSDEGPFEASISTSTGGQALETIPADALQIVARWRVRTPNRKTKVRAVWIAEDVGQVASQDYKVDEASAVATPPETVGSFTLSRPEDGWATGKFRVEFYLGNALVQTRRLTIKGDADDSER